MSGSRRRKKGRLRSFFDAVFRLALPLERETCLFILVSALDVFMTHRLLSAAAGSAGSRFYESNPVANYVMKLWGFPGMVYFKFAMVALVCILAQLIARKKLELARRVLQISTVLVACVVIYSLYLFLRHS